MKDYRAEETTPLARSYQSSEGSALVKDDSDVVETSSSYRPSRSAVVAIAVAALMLFAYTGGTSNAETNRKRPSLISFPEGFCFTDDECAGRHQPAGQLPQVYCRKFQCSAYKNGVGIPATGYPVWIPYGPGSGNMFPPPGFRKVEMPHNVLPGLGPVMEQVWHFDLKNQPEEIVVEETDTEIIVPMFKQMLAGYSRVYHQFGESEQGIVTAAFLPNDFSVVTDKPKAGMIEKYHTLTYDGEMSTVRADRIENLDPDLDAANKPWDPLFFRGLGDTQGALYLVKRTVDAQVEGGIETGHLLNMREEIPSWPVPDPSDAGWSSHSSLAGQQPVDAATKSSLKSENHCKHFESGWGVDHNNTHIILPKNAATILLSGEMVFSPTYYLGFNGGVAVVNYDAENQILEMYYQAYQASRQYTDPFIKKDEWPFPSGIWVSSPGPEFPVNSEDGRTDNFLKIQPPGGALDPFLLAMNAMPLDYSVYARDKEETCPQEFEDSLNWEGPALIEGEADPGAIIGQGVELFHVANSGAPCGGNYMVPDYNPATSAYQINEYGVWNHLILEVAQGHTQEIATAQYWNDWDEFYKSG